MQGRDETNYICIHCSATGPTLDVDAAEIRRWHVSNRGWSDIGYHLVIRRSGVVELGRDLWRQGAHEPRINSESVAVCLIGGVDAQGNPEANYTPSQWLSLTRVIDFLRSLYPGAKVVGHNELSDKACPSFDVQEMRAHGCLNN